ncbi:MAG TPA: 50S ribosomal protein L17 [Patescibacteria group bacterium]|nr:50S ribosomal protein L17 [Patescibacteria group bacterium]
MRHQKKKKIGKGKDHRRKLLRSLASSLILYERIETGYANGRAAKTYAEKAITLSKTNSLHVRRQLLSKLSPMAAKKAVEVLGPKYSSRKGGYTRLIKLNDPKSGASKVMLELVD